MPKPFFITTAIDYTNGPPHIGHAYEKVLADVIARYRRLKGDDVFFLTGVDQHGQKVQQSAEKQGVPPQEFVNEITAKFIALWEKLEVKYDRWAATTDPLHKNCVRAILQKLWDDKDPATGESKWLYKKTEGGWYSVRQEQFLTDKERGADGEFGPEWQPVEFRDEENFYFRLRGHKDWLKAFIKNRSEEGAPFVLPDFRVAELLNAVEKVEGDLCISRPDSRLKWGIPFPESFGAGFVTYVWFDALVNYISFIGYDPAAGEKKCEKQWWPALHVIGKDILIPAHGVYWPVMLKSLGFADDNMPTLLVHGWWNIKSHTGESEKMSKTLGNVVDPDALAGKYGAEALRYYLMSDIATGRDSDFDETRLRVERYNGDLANKLGNLLNRALSMAARYKQGVLKRFEENEIFLSPDPAQKIPFYRKPSEFVSRYVAAFDQHQVHTALTQAMDFAVQCNGYVELTAPWKLAKDPAAAESLDKILYTLAESLRIIAILISPVLPKSAHGIYDQLQWQPGDAGKESRFSLTSAQWGALPDGHTVGKPSPLFPRIDDVKT